MKYFDWSVDKNKELIKEREISFEEIIFWIMHDGLRDILKHPNRSRYPDQKIFVVNVGNYVHIVPFVEDDHAIFLKTIIPSRKMTKKYLGE